MSRPAEFTIADSAASDPVDAYRRMVVSPGHPYIAGGLPMGISSGIWQARAFLEPIADLDQLPPVSHPYQRATRPAGHNAVVASAETGHGGHDGLASRRRASPLLVPGIDVAVPDSEQVRSVNLYAMIRPVHLTVPLLHAIRGNCAALSSIAGL